MLEFGVYCKDLEFFRKCGICYEVLINGWVLDCFYIFCEFCLEWVWCDVCVIRCFLCLRIILILDRGIISLFKNIFLLMNFVGDI